MSVTVVIATTFGNAGASTISGSYNAPDAKLVPSAYRHQTLNICTDASAPPFESLNNGAFVGFDIDLMKAVGRTLDIRESFDNVSHTNLLAYLGFGTCQMTLPGSVYDPQEYSQIYQVEYPYFDDQLEYSGMDIWRNPVGFALARAVQAAERTMIKNGTYEAIALKWNFQFDFGEGSFLPTDIRVQ